MGPPAYVELAKRLRWDAEGLVVRDLARRSVRHPWPDVDSLTLTRGRWDVMDLDVTSPWFDTVPLHVVAEVGASSVRRRLDRDRLVRFGRLLASVDPAASSRPVTRAFLEELAPMMGWATLPGGGGYAWDGDEPWEPPDPDLL